MVLAIFFPLIGKREEVEFGDLGFIDPSSLPRPTRRSFGLG